MNKQLTVELEPKDSLKVVNISISDIQKKLLGDGINQEKRLELEGKLHMLSYQQKELQKKVDAKNSKPETQFYPDLRSDVPMDVEEVLKLIDSV